MTISPVSSNLPLSFQSIALDNLAPEITPVVDSTKSEQNVVQTNAKILTLRAKISSLYSQVTRQQMISAIYSLAAAAFVGVAAYKFSQPAVSIPNPNLESSNVPDSSVSVLNSNGNSTINPFVTTSPLDLNRTCTVAFPTDLTNSVDNLDNALLITSSPNSTLVNTSAGESSTEQPNLNRFAVVVFNGTNQEAKETDSRTFPQYVTEVALNSFEFMKSIEYNRYFNYMKDKFFECNNMLCNIKLAPQGYSFSNVANLRDLALSVALGAIYSLSRSKDAQKLKKIKELMEFILTSSLANSYQPVQGDGIWRVEVTKNSIPTTWGPKILSWNQASTPEMTFIDACELVKKVINGSMEKQIEKNMLTAWITNDDLQSFLTNLSPEYNKLFTNYIKLLKLIEEKYIIPLNRDLIKSLLPVDPPGTCLMNLLAKGEKDSRKIPNLRAGITAKMLKFVNDYQG